jgi:hypothetical protein
MSDDVEMAQDELERTAEHAEEHAASHGDGGTRIAHAKRAAILIATMAAVLAVAESFAKEAQTAYLADQIAVSDTWTHYQAKSVRRVVLLESSDLLASVPDAALPAVAARADKARAEAERMKSDTAKNDGMAQLSNKAHDIERERDHELHRTEGLELAASGLQLSIVLASISVITMLPALMAEGAVLGVVSAAYALMAGFSFI